jgi:CDGSH-type Zn-finger protein
VDIGTRKIVVTKNGPYLVSGQVPIVLESIGVNEDGGSWEWIRGRSFPTRDVVALCRCGGSSNKPFCDGTHRKNGFDGSEVASRAPYAEQAETTPGPAYDLFDAESFCAGARFCDNFGSAWNLVERDDATSRERVIHEVMRCPSGRLVLRDKRSHAMLEPELEASIGVVEDPSEDRSGPLWVRGNIPVESHDGTPYEVRNRVTLCRCGRSQNKPFCDSSHVEAGFKDGL